ncbi:MAG: hypothetical protein LUH07_14515 [Lachnospiraceae bacterium]|nr:hypothetical protein [Lachnospiraceae bacterium]
MTKELTAKELAAVYEGILVDATKEDTYGVAFELARTKIGYDDDYNELSFSGNGYEITFKVDDEYSGDTIESISYDDESQEAYIVFNENVPPVLISKSYVQAQVFGEDISKENGDA